MAPSQTVEARFKSMALEMGAAEYKRRRRREFPAGSPRRDIRDEPS